eukprot:7387602-Prymnesium_polylepis.1
MAQESIILELHYPSNWSFEGVADVLWCEGANGGERSYGNIAQGAHLQQETFEGHSWVVRELQSREVLSTIVARRPTDGNRYHVVTIGADGGPDPLRAALWAMGRAPREPLVKAVATLTKLLENICRAPTEPKFRTIRASNATISSTLD